MSRNYIQAAFAKICTEAVESEQRFAPRYFVSLYESVPFYGGPEEGGWWGSDTVLFASQEFPTEEAANAAYEGVDQLAKDLTERENLKYGEQMLNEMEWLDARGLDADYLPEPDGATSFWVTFETVKGSHENRGNRQYS